MESTRDISWAGLGLTGERDLYQLSPVPGFQRIIAALLVAFWLPASSHSLLEYAGVIHERHANHDADSSGSHEHDADKHEAADGKCVFSSTHVNVPAPDAAANPALNCSIGLDWSSELKAECHPSGLAPPGTAPPQLSHRWQFSFRTALPARAPSLIS